MLGYVFTAMSTAMGFLETVDLPEKPRMADFAKWVTAAEKGGALPWKEGTFMECYTNNQHATQEIAIDASPLATELRKLMQTREFVENTPTEMLKLLNQNADHENKEANLWPKSPSSLSQALRRIAAMMRDSGIDVQTGIKVPNGGPRLIKIKKVSNEPR